MNAPALNLAPGAPGPAAPDIDDWSHRLDTALEEWHRAETAIAAARIALARDLAALLDVDRAELAAQSAPAPWRARQESNLRPQD